MGRPPIFLPCESKEQPSTATTTPNSSAFKNDDGTTCASGNNNCGSIGKGGGSIRTIERKSKAGNNYNCSSRERRQQEVYLLDESGQAYTNWPLPRVWRLDRSKRERRKRLRNVASFLLSTLAVVVGLVLLLLLCWWLLHSSFTASKKLSSQIRMGIVTTKATTASSSSSTSTSTKTTITMISTTQIPSSMLLPLPNTNDIFAGTTPTTNQSSPPPTSAMPLATVTSSFPSFSADNTTTMSTTTSATTTTTTPRRLHFSTQKAASALVGRNRQLQLLSRQQHHQHHHHNHRVIQVTMPARPIEFDRMEVKGGGEEVGGGMGATRKQQVWAQLNNGKVTGRVQQQLLPTVPTTRTNGAKGSGGIQQQISKANAATTQQTLGKEEEEELEEEGEEEEEDDDLYWMRDRPRQPPPANGPAVPPTSHDAMLAVKQQQQQMDEENNRPFVPPPQTDGYEPGRPTIAFGPVYAKDGGEDSQSEGGQQEHGKKKPIKEIEAAIPSQQMVVVQVDDGERRDDDAGGGHSQGQLGENNLVVGIGNAINNGSSSSSMDGTGEQPQHSAHTVAMIQEELNEIIASFERDEEHSPSLAAAAAAFPPFSSSASLEIRPVEIPLDESALLLPPVEQQQQPSMPPDPALDNPMPVWRRAPPGMAPPPPPPPPSIRMEKPNGNPLNMPKSGKELVKERQTLWRRRREAPVLVTALLDIGRGQWQRFTRHFDQYLGYLTNILSRVQNNIVLFGDSTVVAYLRAMRENGTMRGMDWERIQIVEISLRELPFYEERQQINAIIEKEQTNWKPQWDAQMRAHPESLYADYDILVNSKPYFLYNATQISRFPRPVAAGQHQQYFAWLDAGYGHGSSSAIPEGVWAPQLPANQITLIQLPSGVERVERYTLEKIYRKQRSVVSGGFLAGDERVIRRFWTFFFKTFMELLGEEKVDDDQTTLLVTIQCYNSTFHLLRGGWFDAFKLLPSTTATASNSIPTASSTAPSPRHLPHNSIPRQSKGKAK